MKKVLLINGASGVGKSTIAEKLCEDNNFYFIRSYTNRPPRTTDDQEHIYCSDEDIMKLLIECDVVASTVYGGYAYFTLEHQFMEHCVNVYIVDDLGLLNLYNYYLKDKDVEVLSIRIVSERECDRQDRDYTLLSNDYFVVVDGDVGINDVVNKIETKLEWVGWL